MPTGDTDSISLSIVIVNYNVRNLLENCLHSVYSALGSIAAEIFVVDNNSNDGSVDMIRRQFPEVVLIENIENAGFARANNQALQRAKGTYFLLLNPDTIVQEDTFAVMTEFFESTPSAGMAGCKIINPDGTFEPACRRSFPSPWVAFTKLSGLSTLFPRSPLFAKYNLTYLDEDASYEVDAISGSFMFLRKELYDTIGGLDEQYFMYGEDLDWCHRVKQHGSKVFYVPQTRIIHYGGESTNRSPIDSKAIFYQAMEVFAEKNLRISAPGMAFIRLGIKLRLLISRSKLVLHNTGVLLLDTLIVFLSVIAGELLRFGELFRFPAYAYPTIYIVSISIALLSLISAGTYTAANYRFIRSGIGVIISLFVLSSLTFFFKDFAFSRAVVLISSGIMFSGLTGYRLIAILLKPSRNTTIVTGKATLLVGLNENTGVILERLRRYESNIYKVIGIIDTTHQRAGESFQGVPILGSIDNIGKVIRATNATDIIFLPDVLSYGQILALVSRTRGMSIHFRIIPKSMDFIVGKAHIDQLVSIPLVDVDYNLLRFPNRFMKRVFDILVSSVFLVFIYPFFRLLPENGVDRCSLKRFIQGMPAVLRGTKSIVGYPESFTHKHQDVYIGKPGLTGLAQLRNSNPDDSNEVISLSIQYVRNHSVFLDMEILLRTIAFCLSRRN